MTGPGPVDSIDDVDPAWLTSALAVDGLTGSVSAVEASAVGTGQMADSFRVTVSYQEGSGPASVVVKLPASDETSRAAGARGGYANEVRFYAELASTVAVRAPACHYAALADDLTGFVLVLEDLAPGQQGDQIAGCTVEQATVAAQNLAGLHGPRWCDPELYDVEWLSRADDDTVLFVEALVADATDGFMARYRQRLDPADGQVLRAFAGGVGGWLRGRRERFAITHGDYRLDNLLFATEAGGYPVSTVDWQTIAIGLPARDLAYFVGNGLPVAARRANERRIVAAYHGALVGHGVHDYDAAQCWDDYRYGHFQGPLITVLGAMHVSRTDRGDDMFMVMAARSCQAIRDLDAVELLG